MLPWGQPCAFWSPCCHVARPQTNHVATSPSSNHKSWLRDMFVPEFSWMARPGFAMVEAKAKPNTIQANPLQSNQSWPQIASNLPQSWPQVGSNLPQSWPQVGSKLPQSWPQVGSKLPQSWPQVGSKLPQSWPQVGSNLPQSWPQVNSKLPQSWPQVGSKLPQSWPLQTCISFGYEASCIHA